MHNLNTFSFISGARFVSPRRQNGSLSFPPPRPPPPPEYNFNGAILKRYFKQTTYFIGSPGGRNYEKVLMNDLMRCAVQPQAGFFPLGKAFSRLDVRDRRRRSTPSIFQTSTARNKRNYLPGCFSTFSFLRVNQISD